jgi:hypothetical protein
MSSSNPSSPTKGQGSLDENLAKILPGKTERTLVLLLPQLAKQENGPCRLRRVRQQSQHKA